MTQHNRGRSSLLASQRIPARTEPRPPGIAKSRLDDAPSQDIEGSASDGEPENLQSGDGRSRELAPA